jgi:transcriptional regulator with XRE-family HTH domain
MADRALIGANIRRARLEAGLSQEGLAERAWLTRRHLIRLEQGKHMPRRFILGQLAMALDIEIGDLVGHA